MTAETSNARGEWVLVPRELTQGMRSALARAVNASCNTDEWYAHTLAAAPQPPSAPVGVEAPPMDCTATEWLDFCTGNSVEAVAHALAQQPAAPSGEAVEKWGQSYRCGCFLGFPTKASIPGHCPQHLRDKQGAPLPLNTAPQKPASVGEEIMVNAAHDVFTLPLQPSGLSSGPRFVVHVPAPEQQPAAPNAPGCGACADGCKGRGSCRVRDESPPSAPVGVEDGPIDASDNAEYIEHCADRLERCGLRVTAGALRVIAHEHRALAQQPAAVNEADTLLRDLVEALDAAFISSWQSTAAWQKQLDAAREYLAAQQQGGAE